MKGIYDYIPSERERKEQEQKNKINFTDLVQQISYLIPDTKDLTSSDSFEYTADDITNALRNNDIATMREISNYFYKSSTLYKRLILYFATVHKFYYILIPEIKQTNINKVKFQKVYNDNLRYLNNFRFEDKTSDIINTVFREGAFYGYLIERDSSNVWQKLPAGYCRSTYSNNNINVVEFDLKFFEEEYRDEEERLLVLKQYPLEIKKWYNKYLAGKVPTSDDGRNWIVLDSNFATRFCISDDEIPFFFSSLLEIIRLETNKAQRDKQIAQSLYKLLVQKMPLDKTGLSPVFDQDETKAMHSGAVNMLKNAVGTDILTTWAQVDLLNLDSSTRDDGIESNISDFWNMAGTSQMLFDTNGNLSLNYSAIKDASLSMKILESYSTFLNRRLILRNKNKSIEYHFKFLDINIFNEKDKIAAYEKQGTLGYSKLLPAIASGIGQLELQSLLNLENNLLDINSSLIPLQSSYTTSNKEENKEVVKIEEQTGRPEKEDIEKSEKTIKNIN